METKLVERLKQLLDDEAISCTMFYGCMSPMYVYRLWGEEVPMNEIESALKAIKH